MKCTYSRSDTNVVLKVQDQPKSILEIAEALTEKMTYVRLFTEWDNDSKKYYIVDDDGNRLGFSKIVDYFKRKDVFVYCVSSNIVLIPSFHEEDGVMAFGGTYMYQDLTHIMRVAINSSGDVNIKDIVVKEYDGM